MLSYSLGSQEDAETNGVASFRKNVAQDEGRMFFLTEHFGILVLH